MKKQSTKHSVSKMAPSRKLNALAFDIADDNVKTSQNTMQKPAKASLTVGPEYSVDKRREARREHTNHFTNRAPVGSK